MTNSLRISVVFIALVVGGARILPAQSPPTWPVVKAPVTAIGTAEGTPDQELVGVSGARRLGDGRVVIANGNPVELRVYSAAGALVSRVGRKGNGPGEFQGGLKFLSAGADSLLVWDARSTRLMLFLPDGKVVREWPPIGTGSARGQAVFFRRAFGMMMPAALNGCLRQLVVALPLLPAPQMRTIYPDGAGRFWVQVDNDPTWTVYASTGRALGTVHLPARFAVYQVGRDYVLGKTLLEDDVEQVQVLRVAAPAAASPLGPCANRVDSFPDVRPPRTVTLLAGLRSAMTAGEMAYSDYGSYVSSLDSLPHLKDQLPAGTAFRALRADKTGWSAVLFDLRSTLACVFGEAGASPAGWPDGAMRCSE